MEDVFFLDYRFNPNGEYSKAFLNECLSYVDGVLIWKERPTSHFQTHKGYSKYHKSFFGKVAGTKSKSKNKKNTYLHFSIYGKSMLAHRAVWVMHNGSIPNGLVIDHINGIGTDNRIENLRTVSDAENKRNMSLSVLSKSGVTGVVWVESREKWQASMAVNYKNKHLGRFSDFFDAVCARKNAEQVHGFHENHGRAKNGY